MKPADLYYFIGKCLVMDENPAMVREVRKVIEEGKIQWEDFVWISSLSMVTPALFSAFRRNDILPFLPADLCEHLEYLYNLNTSRNERIKAQALEISRLLAERAIVSVFLKGAGHLLLNIYRDPGDRVTGDIDVLVRDAEMDKAAGILLADGYVISGNEPVASYSEHHHFPGMYKDGQTAMVELHRQPVYTRFASYLTAGDVFRYRIQCRDSQVFVPSLTHQMIINFVHSQLTDGGLYFGQPSMKYLYDYYLLAKMNLPALPDTLPGNNRKYNVFRSLVSAVFTDQQCPLHTENFRTKYFRCRHRLLLSWKTLRILNRYILMNLDRTGIYSGLLL